MRHNKTSLDILARKNPYYTRKRSDQFLKRYIGMEQNIMKNIVTRSKELQIQEKLILILIIVTEITT